MRNTYLLRLLSWRDLKYTCMVLASDDFPISLASLHPWSWRNEWPGTALWFSKKYIVGLIAQWHIREPRVTSLLFSLWGRVLSSGLQFRTSRFACGSQRASPLALSYSLWLGVWTPSRLLRLVQSHGKRTVPIATFLSSTSREKQLLQWQARCFASSLLLQEPSPQVCLKWNFKASTFCLASVKSS